MSKGSKLTGSTFIKSCLRRRQIAISTRTLCYYWIRSTTLNAKSILFKSKKSFLQSTESWLNTSWGKNTTWPYWHHLEFGTPIQKPITWRSKGIWNKKLRPFSPYKKWMWKQFDGIKKKINTFWIYFLPIMKIVPNHFSVKIINYAL